MLTFLVPVLFIFYTQGALKLKKNNSGAKGLRAKKETVIQGMIDKLIETGRYYGMEMNVEKKK